MIKPPPHPLGPVIGEIAGLMAAAVLVIGISFWIAGVYSPSVHFLLGLCTAACGIAALYLLFLKRWRWGIYGMIAYLPFAGLPTILLHPAPGWTRLLKDILFILPAYLGFMLWCVKNKERVPPFSPGAPLGLIAILVGLLVIYSLQTTMTNLLVGLIGLKVWLFYLPLYFLGYHLVNSKSQLIRLAQGMLILGIIPVLFGIFQAALVYSGYSDLAYRLYGSGAEMVTQKFAQISLDPDLDPASSVMRLVRIPSLFTFVLQYNLFLMAMLPIAFALSMGPDPIIRHRLWYLIPLVLIVVAAFTSGSRAAYALIPSYFIIVIFFNGRWRNALKSLLWILGLIAVGVCSLLILLGATPVLFLSFATNVIGDYVGATETGLIHQFGKALETTWLGVGVGMSSGPARFAFGWNGFADPISATDLLDIESFYAKAIVEIGLPGLVVVVALLIWLLVSAYRRLGMLHDQVLRAFGVALISLELIILVYLVKGSVIDYDPLNVYFWLYAGLLMKLPEMQET